MSTSQTEYGTNAYTIIYTSISGKASATEATLTYFAVGALCSYKNMNHTTSLDFAMLDCTHKKVAWSLCQSWALAGIFSRMKDAIFAFSI